jgi:signal peptidase I
MSYKLDENDKSEAEVAENLNTLEKGYSSEEDDFEFEEPYQDSSIVDQEPAKKSNAKSFVYDLIFYAVLIFVCIYILPNFVIQRTIVDGSSMANTLLDGEHLYVEKLSYRFDALDRFDIIVFYPYGRENEEYYVKRIIGLPGETVQIIGSDVYINGEVLEEHYGKDPIEDPGRAIEPITLGDDEFFVMGDNRSISKDSRTEEVGNVKKENIGGRAVFRIKPLSRFGTID